MTVTTSEAYGAAVAAEIRAWMGRRGWTQVRLSEELDEDQIWVSRRLKGKVRITVDDLAKFARALDCQIADLLPAMDTHNYPEAA